MGGQLSLPHVTRQESRAVSRKPRLIILPMGFRWSYPWSRSMLFDAPQ